MVFPVGYDCDAWRVVAELLEFVAWLCEAPSKAVPSNRIYLLVTRTIATVSAHTFPKA